MKKLSEQFEDASRPLVWLDAWEYCRRLILNSERLAWNDNAALDDFIRKSDALLHSGINCLPLTDFLAWVVDAMPNLRTDMAEKSRTGYALKTLLSNEAVRQALIQAANIAENAVPNKPLVLAVPSPRYLTTWAYEYAHGKAPDVMGIDQADSGGVYLSDFVSCLGHTHLSAIVVNESGWHPDGWREESSIYTPLRNVTGHQQWSLGVKIPFKPEDEATLANFDFAICPLSLSSASLKAGIWLGEEFWQSDSSAVTEDFSFSVIPVDAIPEKVLEKRKRLGGF